MPNRYYLYGIFPAPGPQDLDTIGLDKQPVAASTLGDFTFLYSEAQQERYLASRKNLLGHERVLEAAMKAGYRTLLPLQFGLIIEAWPQIEQDLLTPQSDNLKQLFGKLDGKREVSVKVLWDQGAELEMLMAENDQLRQQRDAMEGKQLKMDEVVSIGQAIEAALKQRREAIVGAFQTALNPLAKEIVENDPMMDSMIYNAAFLIPWEDEAEFGEAIAALDAQFEDRLRIRYNDFTAPYNFAQLEQN